MSVNILVSPYEELLSYAKDVGARKVTVSQKAFEAKLVSYYQNYHINGKEYTYLLKVAKINN